MSTNEVDELKKEFFKLEEKVLKSRGTWLTRNMSWIISLAVMVVGGVVLHVELRNDFDHHLDQDWHKGMSQTNVKLAEIQKDVSSNRETLKELKSDMKDVKRGLAD